MSVLLLLLSLIVSASCSEVAVLTTKNFDTFIAENELVLVEFYAPWCGHCKKLEPEYDRAAEELKGTDVKLAKVDATAESALGERFNVGGYPTLKIFRSGNPSDYEGGRTSADIVSYMKKQTGPAIKVLTTVQELEDFIPEKDSEEPVVVGFGEEGSEVATFLGEYAKKFRNDFAFGLVTAASAADDNQMNTIVLFKPFDERKDVFSGELNEEALAGFLKANSVRAVAEIGPSNYQSYLKRGLPMSWLFLSDDKKVSDAVQKDYRSIAKDLKQKLSLVYLSGTQYTQMAVKLGLSGNKFPGLTIEKEGLHYVYPEDQQLTAKNMKAWFDKFVSGGLEPTMKSEPIPDPLFDENNVATIVWDNFQKVVLDDTKDVLVEFYAPWCGHCKSLAPIWNQLGQSFKGVDSVVIAKTDATANDYPSDFKVGGFPTIKLVTSKGNKVIDFNGERTLKAFIHFLKLNAATPFEMTEELPKQEPSDNDEL